MFGSLDVLVVDDRPDTVRFLTEFLTQHCQHVDVASSAREATTAINRRRTVREPYHLIISDFVMPEGDGLSLLRDLRNRQDNVPFAFITGYRALNGAFEPDAMRLGALAILDKPIDLRQVEDLLTKVSSQREQKASADQPFFGTSRVIRRSEGAAPVRPAPASDALQRIDSPKPTGSYHANVTDHSAGGALEPVNRRDSPDAPRPAPAVPPTGYQRRPSGFVTPTGAPFTTTTSRLRRSVSGGNADGTSRITRSPTAQVPTGYTARVRRGVSGTDSIGNAPNDNVASREVHCGSCGALFKVTEKPASYVTVCIHCGQLQRIEPVK